MKGCERAARWPLDSAIAAIESTRMTATEDDEGQLSRDNRHRLGGRQAAARNRARQAYDQLEYGVGLPGRRQPVIGVPDTSVTLVKEMRRSAATHPRPSTPAGPVVVRRARRVQKSPPGRPIHGDPSIEVCLRLPCRALQPISALHSPHRVSRGGAGAPAPRWRCRVVRAVPDCSTKTERKNLMRNLRTILGSFSEFI